jgi:hypothetical protein
VGLGIVQRLLGGDVFGFGCWMWDENMMYDGGGFIDLRIFDLHIYLLSLRTVSLVIKASGMLNVSIML